MEKVVNIPEKHIIHKAIEWKRMLDDGVVGSLAEIARREGLTGQDFFKRAIMRVGG